MAKSIVSVFVFLLFSAFFSVSISLPFVLFHGIADNCTSNKVGSYTELLTNLSGSQGTCVEIGNGFVDSWVMPMPKQAEIACEKVKKMKELSHGYNLVGLSQGNLVARGLIEFCDDGPPIKNYVSIAGPHAGLAELPPCGPNISRTICDIVEQLRKHPELLYTDLFQSLLAPSGYIKILTEKTKYLQGCSYLPKLSNELPNEKNSTYKERFSSLQNLVLIMFENDTVLIPRETSWFGFYPDGGDSFPVLSPNQTKLYKEDWIGLKTLDDAGKVKYISLPGGHLDITDEQTEREVIPYLRDQSGNLEMEGQREGGGVSNKAVVLSMAI